jgi:archaellum component FlaC
MIRALWDHMLRIWQYQNEALHEDDSEIMSQFKVEALDKDIERLEATHADLRSKLHKFQERHMDRREHIQTLQHNIMKLWASLENIYFDEAENRIERDTHLLDQYLQGRVGVG